MNSDLQTISLTWDGPVARVLLHAPPVNIITRQMLEDLSDVFSALERHPGLRCVILSSALPNIFCAGADIKAFQAWDSHLGQAECLFGSQVFDRIARFPCPVICALNGNAFGGGLELALACDIRIFDERAAVALPECSLGMQPGYGGTQRLPRLVGPGFARRMMFTGDSVNAQTALRVGLADELAPGGQCLEQALSMAHTIARRAPIAVAQIKKSVAFSMGHSLRDGLAFENQGISILCGTRDKQEGACAFTEKRDADFQGI